MNIAGTIAAALILSGSGMAAHAATVFSTGTVAGGSQFSVAGDVTVAVSDPANAWDLTTVTAPGSEWIWAEDLVNIGGTFGGPVTFLVTFTLSATQAASATLSGMIGLDDFGDVTLNGNSIFSDFSGNNYSSLQSFGTVNSALFVAGNNTLSFYVNNDGGSPAGLRATVVVSAVPLPAALPLLASTLLVGGFVARRRKQAALAA